jgi:hypothetical protein
MDAPLANSMPTMATESTVAIQVSPNGVRHGSESERMLIRKWLDQTRVPGWLQVYFNRWESDRKYLHTKLFGDEANPNELTINLAARAVQQRTTKIMPTDADVQVKQDRSVGSVELVRRDAIRQAAMEIAKARYRQTAQDLLAAPLQFGRTFLPRAQPGGPTLPERDFRHPMPFGFPGLEFLEPLRQRRSLPLKRDRIVERLVGLQRGSGRAGALSAGRQRGPAAGAGRGPGAAPGRSSA